MIHVDQFFDDGGARGGYIAKGHVTREEMLEAIRWGHDETFTFEGMMEYGLMRCIPDQTDYWTFRYEPSKPGRGAFTCTVIYL